MPSSKKKEQKKERKRAAASARKAEEQQACADELARQAHEGALRPGESTIVQKDLKTTHHDSSDDQDRTSGSTSDVSRGAGKFF